MYIEDIIKKINAMSDDEIDESVSEIELAVELDEMMAINSSALNLTESKETCKMLNIPYSDATAYNNYRKLQLYAYHLKQE